MRDLPGAIRGAGFETLPITLADAGRAGGLPEPSRDPFDRMLIAQALEHDLALVSTEEPFDADHRADRGAHGEHDDEEVRERRRPP